MRTSSSKPQARGGRATTALLAVLALWCATAPAQAQVTVKWLPAAELRQHALAFTDSLKLSAVRDAPNFGNFVVDRQALLQLGKALFWDRQLGSDGQACASCHFHAGADNRSKNQLNPGLRSTLTPGGDTLFGASPKNGGTPLSANYQLTPGDFPFHKLADPADRSSAVLSDTNDVVSSQGVMNATFVDIATVGRVSPEYPHDAGMPHLGLFTDPASGAMVRNVAPRNAPTVINAVLNQRNFWDGRGRGEFNGVNPIGSLQQAPIVKTAKGVSSLVQIRLKRSSAASQATGPGLNSAEMSYGGRNYPELGRKLLQPGLRPLGQQDIAADDSVLGAVRALSGPGLDKSYADLIRQAIDPFWWRAPAQTYVDVSSGTPTMVTAAAPGPKRFTVMEYNFSLYMGLAIEEYEKTLIANDSPFDRFMEGKLDALDRQQRLGLQLFLNKGRCINCHGGPEFTNASQRSVRGLQVLERMMVSDDRVAVYDNGFYNIGVRPTAEDLGVGGRENNRPLSNSRLFQQCVRDKLAAAPGMPVAEANEACSVPGIRARPLEAATLLSRASAQIGKPMPVEDLLAAARLALAGDAPDVVKGSCLLASNPMLACPTTTATVQQPDGSTGTVTVQVQGALDLLATAINPPGEFKQLLAAAARLLPDPERPGTAPQLVAPPLQPDERVAVDGAKKTPTVRNVELTAPYFSNGGQATLRQVVEFYNRGGDFAVHNRDDLAPDIRPLGLTEEEIDALVAFMLSLTDPRVRRDRAPFDHPGLPLPNGGGAAPPQQRDFGNGRLQLVADDQVLLPAVGRGGSATPLGTPYTPFANFLDPLK